MNNTLEPSLLKVAIVYDWVDSWGGAERLILILRDMFPSADFYTSHINAEHITWPQDNNIEFNTSFMQQLPRLIRNNRILCVPFYPFAFESFNLNKYNLVISLTSGFAKAVITRPETLHICYVLSPTRFLWNQPHLYIYNLVVKKLLSPYISYLKKWDIVASKRPDHYIAISKHIQAKIQEIYHRTSKVLYPPFDVDYWKSVEKNVSKPRVELPEEYYLVVSRLVPYKKIDLVIEAFKHIPLKNLVVIGRGSQARQLQKNAQKNVIFLDGTSDEELAYLYKHAKALIMPQEEDFGYTALEALFYGCPVISYNKGGVQEIVTDNATGIFFTEQTTRSLLNAIEKIASAGYNLKYSLEKNRETVLASFGKKYMKQQLFSLINEWRK